MTKDEALKLALEALETLMIERGSIYDKALTAIKEALVNEALEKMAENARKLGLDYEPEQEPVAWVDLLKEAQQIVESKVLWKRFIDGTPLSNDIACWMAAFAQQHTTPPQRTWVGLTDKEIDELWMSHHDDFGNALSATGYERAIEAKLKERNT